MAWQQRTDELGATYYQNTATGASSWLKLADDATPSASDRIAPSTSNDNGAFDYDAFWRDAWRTANATAPPAWLGRRPPRVFVYDDLPAPFSDWSPDGSGAEATAFGRPLGGSVYDTSGYAFAAMVHYRLSRSAHRTRDPAAADVFFAPILTKPKRHHALLAACAEVGGRTAELLAALRHLNARTAPRHFVILSKEHPGTGTPPLNCSGWFNHPAGLLRRAVRVSYSHPQPAAYRGDVRGYGKQLGIFIDAAPYPHAVSFPYPGGVHVAGPGAAAPFPWDTSQPRPHRLLFTGRDSHGDTAVRRHISKQCRSLRSPRCVSASYDFGKGLRLKQQSDFCLEPGGDTPYRKSLADSIGCGCIPLIFHVMTDNANEWLWEGWKEGARVLVPRKPFLDGALTLERLVDTMPPRLLEQMKATLAANARRFTISLADDPGDAVHALVLGVERQARLRDQAEADR